MKGLEGPFLGECLQLRLLTILALNRLYFTSCSSILMRGAYSYLAVATADVLGAGDISFLVT